MSLPVGVVFRVGGDIAEKTDPDPFGVIATARHVEQLGFEIFYLDARPSSSLSPSQASVYLGAVSAVTETLELGVVVAVSDGTHPSIVQKSVSSLDACSNDRGRLALALAKSKDRAGIDLVREVSALKDGLAISREMSESDFPRYDGVFFRIDGARNKPRKPLRTSRTAVLFELERIGAPRTWVGASLDAPLRAVCQLTEDVLLDPTGVDGGLEDFVEWLEDVVSKKALRRPGLHLLVRPEDARAQLRLLTRPTTDEHVDRILIGVRDTKDLDALEGVAALWRSRKGF